MVDSFGGFKLFLLRRGKRQSTIYTHITNIKRVLSAVQPLTRENIENYILTLQEQGKKETYINHMMDAVSLYGQYKGIEELQHIPRLKEKEHIKATMSDEEIETFLALPCSEDGRNNVEVWNMWTLFWSVCAYTGMRPGEVAGLTIDAVDFGRNIFILDVTKTNPRLVPIPPHLKAQIKQRIESLDGELLFPSPNKKGLIKPNLWFYNFRLRLKMLNIKRTNLTAYSLRHSFITRMLDEDVNLFKVQKIVGHKNIETTAHYTHLTTKDIISALKKDPLSRKNLNPKEILTALKEAIQAFRLHEDDRFAYKLEEGSNSLTLTLFVK